MGLKREELLLLVDEIQGLREVRAYLVEQGYNLKRIAEVLGHRSAPKDMLPMTGWLSYLQSGKADAVETPLQVLVRLFFLSMEVEESICNTILPPRIRALLTRVGLIRFESNRCSARVSLIEFDSFLFLSDLPFINRDGEIKSAGEDDPVMPMHFTSLALNRRRPDAPKRLSLLDVGSGSGCLSVASDEHYERIRGVDLNPRCVMFSKINAMLNGARAEYDVANCLELSDSSRFDHIVFNVPSVPRYKESLSSITNFSSERERDLITQFLSDRLHHLLAPEGICQLFAIFTIPQSHTVESFFQDYFGGQDRYRFEVEILKGSPFSLSTKQVEKKRLPMRCLILDDPADRPTFFDFLEKNEIGEIVSTVVHVCFDSNPSVAVHFE